MEPVVTRPATRRNVPHRQYHPTAPALTAVPGLYSGEPETCRRALWPFLANLFHLGSFLIVFKVYRVEGRAFQGLVTLALAALPIHYALHYRWKKLFFVLVSIGGMTWVFNWLTAGCVLSLSAVLIGICYLPIAWRFRAGLLGASAIVLAVGTRLSLRSIPDDVWPIVAMLFMFRMIIYLYELRHAKKPEPLVDTLSYFFLLPNFCFLHFPVVDYRTMQRGYFVHDIHDTQRTGLRMIFHGLVHLLLYRLVDHEWRITPGDVHNLTSLGRYLVCNYLLYLRVSGQFHMACGLLHLFGFQLPKTHHHYLLATGFTDYWRRINIYWKDFMVRVVFHPVVFRLKRWPQPAALALATSTVFVVTWLLHAYQSFWLRGLWGFSVPDALFWGILGLLVLINVERDGRRLPARPVRGYFPLLGMYALRSAKIAGTFLTITVLWSLWSSPSVEAWLQILGRGLAL